MVRCIALSTILFLGAGACRRNAQLVDSPATSSSAVRDSSAKPTLDPLAQRDEAVQALLRNFERVHFETDSDRLSEPAKAALTTNSVILADHLGLRVEVQGHADERGTIDYNLALGQRRARAVVAFLRQHGVAPSRLPTVSYGEERPLQAGLDTVAWSQNRRAEFRVLSADDRVQGTTER